MNRTFLMCPPEYFDLASIINPWMRGNLRNVDNRLAKLQWRGLYDRVRRLARVRLMQPVPSSPDMVFTANAGLVHDKNFIVSRFRQPERQSEEPYYVEWFTEHGYEVAVGPPDIHFEGAGDALFDRGLPVLWMAHGHGSMREASAFIANRITALSNIEIVVLELVDQRFHRLDTCFCPLEGGVLLYCPMALTEASLAAIEARVPEKRRIACNDADAIAFACNAINIGRTVIVGSASPAFVSALAAHGFTVEQNPLSEFMKAGGSARSLTLDIS